MATDILPDNIATLCSNNPHLLNSVTRSFFGLGLLYHCSSHFPGVRKLIYNTMTRTLSFLGLLLLLTGETTAFAPEPSHSSVYSSVANLRGPRTQESSSTALPAIRRRAAFDWFKKAVLAGVGLSTATSTVAPASAEDEAGKIVTFQVDNLDGLPGNTGTFKVQLQPSWAPRGVERFEVRSSNESLVLAVSQSLSFSYAITLQKLTAAGFWDGCRVFRVIPGFICQFGINGDPAVQSKWRGQILMDDPVKVTNARGTVVFATAGPNSRTTQIFINTREQGNAFLDNQGFSPIGKVIEGMDVVDRMYAGYGEGAPAGKGPNQGKIQLQGNEYLEKNYPKLSYFTKAII